MDLDDLRRKAKAARQFEVPLEGGAVVFSLVVPTRYDSKVAYSRSGMVDGENSATTMIRWTRAVLLISMAGWTGATERHVLDGGGDEPLPFSAVAAEMLLDAQPAWEEALAVALLDRIGSRKAVEDTAAKN